MHVAVLSFTSIADDSRVLRTIETLAAAGHRVTAIGFGAQPNQACAFVRLPASRGRLAHRLSAVLTQAPANFLPASALPLHFLSRQHRAARAALLALKPDVVHANDALALPSAMAAKHAFGAHVVYDSHEFASEEHADNIHWRLVAQRHIREIERLFIGEADHVITVSDGIARSLRALYALPADPEVVRNTPNFALAALKPLSGPRRLLFHGVLKRGRGIEAAIEALRHLSDCVLTVRGNGAPAYLAGLRSLAARLGLADRVSFEAAVPQSQVIALAAEAHIGIFCAPTQTRHNRFALPNKIFEYLMAGLAVAVTADTDLAALVATHGCGFTASTSTPEAIAAAIREVSAAELQAMRLRALEAARQLSWEREQEKLLRIYQRLAALASSPAKRASN